MAKQKNDTIDEVLTVLQNLFILEALKAGMNVDDIRETLHVNKWRVSNISKTLKRQETQNRPQHRPLTEVESQ